MLRTVLVFLALASVVSAADIFWAFPTNATITPFYDIKIFTNEPLNVTWQHSVATGYHNFLEVNQAGFDTCALNNGTNAVKLWARNYNNFTYVIPANTYAAGTFWFICDVNPPANATISLTDPTGNTALYVENSVHCTRGMKLKLTVTAPTTAAPTTTCLLYTSPSPRD
eukprot:TRINITY_DN3407_c0_g1_i1.p1 TRINITY_DN3407_c0_g1~~TRINITY_DN3407_c0_g1_i1.p1  ORF type:complete len:185 (+),score=56.73 TRINITY_DN3407_c0_g1_i1:51-557(+)